MRTDELDYDLPPDRLATTPAEPRDVARLMVCRRESDEVAHAQVRDLPRLGVLRGGDLMIVNRTKVLPAMFEGRRSGTGGRVKGLFVDEVSPLPAWIVMLEARGSLQPGEVVALGSGIEMRLRESRGRGTWLVNVEGELGGRSTASILDSVGQTPLPPYIRKARKAAGLPEVVEGDAERYNTIYASDPGSVAAPTAGLHFTPSVLAELETLGVRRAEVTLSVGLGTFEPVRADTLEGHAMHRERFVVPRETLRLLRETREGGGRVFVVGTTSVRALESVPEGATDAADVVADTGLFIHPDAGFAFRHTDLLMTNFHLPRSTLLALVATLPGVGLPRLKHWYAQAIEHGYRFYSYGDAMLVV